jgi:hypothetical protein
MKNSNMKIEIAVACTWFQRRLNWMISSVVEQKGEPPDITFSVAYPPRNGNPTTEELCQYFHQFDGNKFRLREVPVSMEEIRSRGLVRNRQLSLTDADFILFADADMVYDPEFFSELMGQLKGVLAEETRCISASRISLDKQFSRDFFNIGDGSKIQYPQLIKDPASIVSKWPIFKITSNIGAGNFQLANVKNLRDNHHGYYVDPAKAKRDFWTRTKSDKRFRTIVGGICKIKTKPQYHLNHERDNEYGDHLEIQR